MDTTTDTDNKEIETTEHGVQTSLLPTPLSSTYPSDVSSKSDISSDCLSVTKLDALLTNSMKIMVKRSNTIAGSSEQSRRLSALKNMRRPADVADGNCPLECCTGIRDIPQIKQLPPASEPVLSKIHGRSAMWLPEGNNSKNLTKMRQLLRSASNNSASSGLNNGLIGVSVDQKRPYRPQTRTSSRKPVFLDRSRTTLASPTSASRHCDACSVKGLQDWFQNNPSTVVRRNEVSPLRKSDMIGREKSQVFLLNKPRHPIVGGNVEEAYLPTTTIPRKGLIKLTYMNEDQPDTPDFRSVRRSSPRRDPIRFLIKNKDIVKEIRRGYKLLEEKPVHSPGVLIKDINKLTTEDLRNQILSFTVYDRRETD